MAHKILIYISMMGFLLWIKNDKVHGMALRVNGGDKSFVCALERQILHRVAVHISPYSHLPFLWVNILIHEKQEIDFHAGHLYRARSHLLY